jgi:mono/diheme cytochrome c family protein
VLGLTAGCGGSSTSQTTTGSTGGDIPQWVQAERLPRSAVPGAAVFVSAGCTACHTYAGSGHAVSGAPDLTAYGQLHLGTAFTIHFLRCPSCVKSGSPMPRFDSLGTKRLRQLAVFLGASKGTG